MLESEGVWKTLGEIMKQTNLSEYLVFPQPCLYTSWSMYLFILKLPHNCIRKIISWVASLAVFPLWAEFYFFSSCYEVCSLPWNLCNFVFLDQELVQRWQCRILTLCVQYNSTLLWRKWFRKGEGWGFASSQDLLYGEEQRFHGREQRRGGLFPALLAD